MHNETFLEQFVLLAFSNKAAGIIVNIGPYISTIPNSIITFANEHDFPVFHTNKHTQYPFLKNSRRNVRPIKNKHGSLDVIIGKGNFYRAYENVRKSYNESLTVIQRAQLHNNPYLSK